MTLSNPVDANPANWGLSEKAFSTLVQMPEITQDLAQQRMLPPLPPGYRPKVIEVLFDDVLYVKAIEGVLTYIRDCLPHYQPVFIEYRFDDEIALFQIGSEYVVNRITGIAQIICPKQHVA